VTIIGLAAKDAILIVEFARTLRAQGKPLIESAIEASYLRFRPILMTGFAFVFGVAPMVVASGASSKSQQALGTGVMGGMNAVVILADGADVLCRGSKPVWPPIANGRRAHPSSQDATRDCGHRALAARSPQERARTGTAVIKLMVALALSYLDIR
jgi:hypothetical protein